MEARLQDGRPEVGERACRAPLAGVISGALAWLGFVLTTIVVNNAYTFRRPLLTAIDSVHWLGVLVLMGTILGWLGR